MGHDLLADVKPQLQNFNIYSSPYLLILKRDYFKIC